MEKKSIQKKDIALLILLCAVFILSVQLLSKNMEKGANNMEIERKFLLNLSDLPADIDVRSDIFDFVQTYISYSPEMRVRNVNDTYYYFTIKRPKDKDGLVREEIEFLITEEEYAALVKKQEGATIYKTRYQFYEQSFLITVDVYSHELTGLAVAEVEFETAAQAEKYTLPQWFGKEITSDNRYKNANLAKNGQPREH